MENKSYLDLRVLRTRKSIRNAFIALLEEKEYSKISVNAIAKRAEINRVTFYSHYKDIHDLVESFLNELLADIHQILTAKANVESYQPGIARDSLVLLLEHIAENAQIYKALLVSKHIPFFTPKLMELMHQLVAHTEDCVKKDGTNRFLVFKTPSDISSWYATSALVGTILMWLAHDMPYAPQELAQQLIDLNPFKPAESPS
ncbi:MULTISPECIES: TetR/AcrR family transcriptional regulator [Shouchella]|uniref:TetR/AcrR family transcriptional regulator n=1 Tax=Shouchella TaxID=2893057 RepID=UPI000923EFE8|nr:MULTISPECIES: TetR/AcrR family transcriptional regulator [Shouchella]MCM3314582.1 TetR/AcrR family transcriptional regulator C-terminal domain-containing protein [Psychrobacillus sp. MER TA 17]MBX0317404.1 TetR/AcrR family transcriptional regulator C-terminal domain-containing protein [Shouchella clausii]MCM3379485.1 TetR/AcrR family transcriptional regulator C-terminal domain-containing protein [Shouchella rhizosphaerae]MDO7283474.1 TetR/AcrR family transcriptional regulator [Shouchella cla